MVKLSIAIAGMSIAFLTSLWLFLSGKSQPKRKGDPDLGFIGMLGFGLADFILIVIKVVIN